jgi:hypothetical protein
MGALSGVIAHGGVAGAIVESLVALAVLGVFVAVWLRERGSGPEREGPASLRDEEDDPRR